MQCLVRVATFSGEMTGRGQRNAGGHWISALILRCAHLAQETLAFPKQEKRPLQWQKEGSLRPEMAAQQSALKGPRFCLCAHVCAHVDVVIKAASSHYSCWRRGQDSWQGTVYKNTVQRLQKNLLLLVLWSFNV